MWTPRSQRLGMNDFDGPYEGVPAHLKPHLLTWLKETLESTTNAEAIARVIALRLNVVLHPQYRNVYQLQAAAEDDPELLLDCVEGALHAPQKYNSKTPVTRLRDLLKLAGSAYTVADDDVSIVDVTADGTEEVRSRAMSVQDEATAELSEAWVKAFGRSPDASDAWDHAIKAVETVLKPAVEPKNNKSTLGSIIAALSQNGGSKWECVFPGVNKDHDVATLVGTLRPLWPNPDRHGPVTRPPTLPEARAVVVQAATIVQWHREDWVVRER